MTFPLKPLAGQVAIITGAGRGMGRAHAELLAQNGASVVVHDIVQNYVNDTVSAIGEAGGIAVPAVADVADISAMEALVRSTEDKFGRIDILVNNAGIGADRATITNIDDQMFQRMFDIHVRGPFVTTRAVVPGMQKRRSGAIINISSIWGLVGHDFGSTYCAAKAAMLGFTKSWAKEFAPYGITVNAIAPGGVNSPMAIEKDGLEAVQARQKAVPLGRWAEPEEVAHAVLYFCSPQAKFVTGQVLAVSGGQSII